MNESNYSRLIPADPQNPAERDLWNAVCHSMTGASIFTSNTQHILSVIDRLKNENWRKQMRPEFLQGLLDVAVPDLEQRTFIEEGPVAVAAVLVDPSAERVDLFDVNMSLDRLKARTARSLSAALRENLAKL